jgi:hypothetical protein
MNANMHLQQYDDSQKWSSVFIEEGKEPSLDPYLVITFNDGKGGEVILYLSPRQFESLAIAINVALTEYISPSREITMKVRQEL